MKKHGLRLALICATIGALALAGGIAYATIPDAGGVIHTCFSKATGTWRPIDTPSQSCKSGEVQLDIYSKAGADNAFQHSNAAAGGDLTGTYPNPTIATGKVSTGKLADGAVTTLKLADGSVNTGKIIDGQVTNGKLANPSLSVNAGQSLTGGGSVFLGGSTTLGVASGGIGTDELANGAATNAKLDHSSLTLTAGTGLTGGGSVSLGGSTTLGLQNGYALPQACASGQFPMWDGSKWFCQDPPPPVSKYYRQGDTGTSDDDFSTSHSYATSTANCPIGTQAVGGGYYAGRDSDPSLEDPNVIENRPTGAINNSWTVTLQDLLGAHDRITAFVICLPLS